MVFPKGCRFSPIGSGKVQAQHSGAHCCCDVGSPRIVADQEVAHQQDGRKFCDLGLPNQINDREVNLAHEFRSELLFSGAAQKENLELKLLL